MPPLPLRADFDAKKTRATARWSKDGPQARRLLALAAIYDGTTRAEAAKFGGVTVQIVRDWGDCQTACSCPRWWLAPHYVLSEGCAGSASVEPLT
jgi:hypothetical protein